MNKQNIINEITKCAESNGWSVDIETNQDRQETLFTFSQYTPAGQDFFFLTAMQSYDLGSLTENIKEHCDDFDVYEEAFLWLDETGHGKNGAPYRMKDVIEDMEKAKRMMGKLLDAVIELKQSL